LIIMRRHLLIVLVATSGFASAQTTEAAFATKWNPATDRKPLASDEALAVPSPPAALSPALSSRGVPRDGVPAVPRDAPQSVDYAANMTSDTFGAQLFTGAFSREGPSIFNPDYVVSVGDRIQLRMWNGYWLNNELVVDASGNIDLPEIGPYSVRGVPNERLQVTIAPCFLAARCHLREFGCSAAGTRLCDGGRVSAWHV
jgi:hypothetical protein